MLFKSGQCWYILRLSSREFHSLMDDGIQYFCEILVRLRGTDILLLVLKVVICVKDRMHALYQVELDSH